MSRYYNIVIGPETQTQPGGQPASNAVGITFTNQVNGKANLNGPQVEFDLPVTKLAGSFGVTGAGRLTVRGVSIQQISQSMNFNGSLITISAGMQNGLPLATAAANQNGVLLQGTIKSAYGNWVGVEQSLEFIIMPPDFPIQGGPSLPPSSTSGNPANIKPSGPVTPGPANITFNWPQGTNLGDMIKTVVKTAFPTYKIGIFNISPNLVLTQDEPGFYHTLPQFADFANKISLEILGASNPKYTGVDIVVGPNKTLNITDNISQTASNTTVATLAAQDFIGQPTWLGPNTIQFNTVLRADLNINGYFKFPIALNLQTITTPNSDSFARQNTTFSGTWQIIFIRHLGNSRGPNAMDWVSTFQAVSADLTAVQASSGNTSS